MRAVVSLEFSKDPPHMDFDGFFRDRKVRCDIFIGIPRGDLLQHLQFAFAKSVRGMMFCHGHGNFRWNSPLANVYAANRVQEILPQSALEQVSAASAIESMGGLDITFIRR